MRDMHILFYRHVKTTCVVEEEWINFRKEVLVKEVIFMKVYPQQGKRFNKSRTTSQQEKISYQQTIKIKKL